MKIERYLTQGDAALLSRLAEQLLRVRNVKFNIGEELIELISNAILLPENAQREDCVSLHSEVTYARIGQPGRMSLAIVYPRDANQALARVSVLAPIALAFIGRPVGSIVEVELPFGQHEQFKIIGVTRLPSAVPLDDEDYRLLA